MRASFGSVAVSLFTATFVACGDDGSPNSRDLGDRYAVEIPAYWKADKFTVEAQENLGSTVEPAWASRFVAELKLEEDTYRQARRDGDVLFVTKIADKGAKRTVYGKALSGLRAGAWETAFQMEEDPTISMGQPLASFSAPRIIVTGSTEEKAHEEEKARAAAEERDALARFLSAGFFSGTATQGATTHEFRLHILTFDPRTGAVSGRTEWPSIDGGAVKTFSGRLDNRTLILQENGWVKRVNALGEIEFSLNIPESLDRIEGRWSWGSGAWDRTGGDVNIVPGT